MSSASPLWFDRAPQIDQPAVDLAEDLVETPRVSEATPLAPKPASTLCSESQTPTPDGLVRDFHAPLEHRLLDVAKAQAEAKVKPYAAGDNLAREAVTTVTRGC